MARLEVSLDDETATLIRQLAAHRGVSVSEVVAETVQGLPPVPRSTPRPLTGSPQTQ